MSACVVCAWILQVWKFQMLGNGQEINILACNHVTTMSCVELTMGRSRKETITHSGWSTMSRMRRESMQRSWSSMYRIRRESIQRRGFQSPSWNWRPCMLVWWPSWCLCFLSCNHIQHRRPRNDWRQFSSYSFGLQLGHDNLHLEQYDYISNLMVGTSRI
jgi:hypothetical protein